MTEQKNYTFSLSPREKRRFVAGNYDKENSKPFYEIEILCPEHVRNQIDDDSYLVDAPDSIKWAYKVHNKSSYTVFIIIKKDGVLIRK